MTDETGTEETGAEHRSAAQTEIERVSTLELFLDLVFVFTVTQLTGLVSESSGGGSYATAALILSITWWMYDGYVWLTGNTPLDRPRLRLVLFAGMGGFLLMAIAIPGAFGATEHAPSDTGVLFGCAYLAVTLVHAGLFALAPNRSSAAIRRIAPFNIGGALIVIATGFLPEDRRWAGMLAAILVVTSSSLWRREQEFTVNASHFAERHGLVIIIALGESIVDIGLGTSGARVDAALVLAALAGLSLSAAMWWVYFDRDDSAAESALRARQGPRRSQLGLSLAYTHLVMIAGIVVMSAGVKVVVADPAARAATRDAWNLAAGVGIYLIGEGAFTMTLDRRRPVGNLVSGLLVLGTVPIGTRISGLAQLVAAVGVVVGLIASDQLRRARTTTLPTE